MRLGRPEEATPLEQTSGNLSKDDEKKLMNSVMEGENSEEARLIMNAMNHGVFAFNPDMMFEQMVSNYQEAEKLYGEGFLQYLGASERDMRFPEVQRDIKDKIRDKIEQLQYSGFLDDEFEVTDKGVTLAALNMYMEELDKLEAKGLVGEHMHRTQSHYGASDDIRSYKRGDRFKDIAIRRSIKQAIRHSHSDLHIDDLKIFERQSKGKIHIIYGLDSSGSMKGKKIETGKRAGVALAYKAIEEHDKVGLIVFGSEVEESIAPTDNFMQLVQAITKIRAKKKTNMRDTILKSIELFSTEDITKHLILITDAVPTEGDDPRKETLDAVEQARHAGITISVIGIKLDKDGEELAQEISAAGEGKLYVIEHLDELDRVVLMDYYGQL